MTEWKGTLKGTEDTYPHLSSVRDRFKENDDIVHAAICDAALSLISDQALAIHRLRESMRILACLNPNIENDVDNPWLVAHQVREHVRGRIEGLEKRVAELEKVLTKADEKMERLEQYMDRVQNLIAFFHADIQVALSKDKK
jgi:uncharacterized coiled-coil protein SlyX